eukprot:scaffold26288_cov111-Isochrysis_galbana.AAC.7
MRERWAAAGGAAFMRPTVLRACGCECAGGGASGAPWCLAGELPALAKGAEAVHALVPRASTARGRLPSFRAEVSLFHAADLEQLRGVPLGADAVRARSRDVAPRPVELRLPVVTEPAEAVLVALATARAAQLAAHTEVLLRRLCVERPHRLKEFGIQAEEAEASSRLGIGLSTRTHEPVRSNSQIAGVEARPHRHAGGGQQHNQDGHSRTNAPAHNGFTLLLFCCVSAVRCHFGRPGRARPSHRLEAPRCTGDDRFGTSHILLAVGQIEGQK